MSQNQKEREIKTDRKKVLVLAREREKELYRPLNRKKVDIDEYIHIYSKIEIVRMRIEKQKETEKNNYL